MPQQKRDQVQKAGNFLVWQNYPQHFAKHPNTIIHSPCVEILCAIGYLTYTRKLLYLMHLLFCLTCCQLIFFRSVWSISLYAVCVTSIRTILFSLWICTGNKSTWFTEVLWITKWWEWNGQAQWFYVIIYSEHKFRLYNPERYNTNNLWTVCSSASHLYFQKSFLKIYIKALSMIQGFVTI